MPLPDPAHGRKRLPFVGGDTTHRLREELEPTSRVPQNRNAKAHPAHDSSLSASKSNKLRASLSRIADRRIRVNRPSGSDLAEMAPPVGWVGAPAACLTYKKDDAEQIRTSPWLRFGCTCGRLFLLKRRLRLFTFNEIDMADGSPEKAGVGCSIPSLATNCIRHFSKSGGTLKLPVT
jgi:hypothetical protein